MRPLIYLTLRQWKNSIRRIPGSPRLLIPVLFFVLIFVLQLVVWLFLRPDHNTPLPVTPRTFVTGSLGALIATMRGLLLFSTLTATVSALGQGNLFITPSDIDFLLTAPVRAREVLFFKMFGRYMGLGMPAAYFPFILGSALVASHGSNPWELWPGILGSWLYLVAITNVAQAALMRRASRDKGQEGDEDERRTRWRGYARQVATIVYTVIIFGGMIWVFHSLPDRHEWRNLLRTINGSVATTLLLPVAWASDLFRVPFEGWTGAAVGRLLGLLALNGVSFALLFSRKRDFYEGATEFSEARMQVIQATRRGDSGTILSQMARDGKFKRGYAVRELGGGAAALVWKDLTGLTRVPIRNWITLLTFAALPAIVAMLFGRTQSGAGVLSWMVFFLLNMSGLFLLGLRDMLRRADITKSFPVHPMSLMAGELVVPIVEMILLGWVSLGFLALLGAAQPPYAWVAVVTLPSVAALLIVTQACFILLYPNQNDKAQSGVGNMVGLLASVVALLPQVVIGVALVLLKVPHIWLAVALFGVNTVAAFVALACAALLWGRFDPTD